LKLKTGGNMTVQIQTDGLVGAERLRETLALLRDAGAKGITKLQLSKRLGGVSPRTVDRAIRLLEEQGARIDKERWGKPAFIHFQLKKGPKWDEHVSGDARMALRLASLALSHSGTLLWQDKIEALEELASGHMSTRDRQIFEQLQKAVRVQGGVLDPVEVPDVLEPLLKALEGRKELEVDYLSAGAKEPSTLKVIPYALTHDLYSGGAFLLVWDPKRGKPIHLRLGRINRAKALAKTAVLTDPELMELAARYQIGGWTSDELPFEVKVRIEGTHWVQAFKEAPPALPDFETFLAQDGKSAEIRFKANHTNGASRWILQFGECAEVLEPSWLRENIKARLEAAARNYR
jgi:predicted DNA-binding transcriptional regulator YafY